MAYRMSGHASSGWSGRLLYVGILFLTASVNFEARRLSFLRRATSYLSVGLLLTGAWNQISMVDMTRRWSVRAGASALRMTRYVLHILRSRTRMWSISFVARPVLEIQVKWWIRSSQVNYEWRWSLGTTTDHETCRIASVSPDHKAQLNN